ncbi:hypothetical protein FVB9288_03343 [Flavobacterium sp. CECT 9288]|jgi:hypothetical protein|nr:hypothetical protein FVB9288_03343 [Flavobacterium sp. CECT 9288]
MYKLNLVLVYRVANAMDYFFESKMTLVTNERQWDIIMNLFIQPRVLVVLD